MIGVNEATSSHDRLELVRPVLVLVAWLAFCAALTGCGVESKISGEWMTRSEMPTNVERIAGPWRKVRIGDGEVVEASTGRVLTTYATEWGSLILNGDPEAKMRVEINDEGTMTWFWEHGNMGMANGVYIPVDKVPTMSDADAQHHTAWWVRDLGRSLERWAANIEGKRDMASLRSLLGSDRTLEYREVRDLLAPVGGAPFTTVVRPSTTPGARLSRCR